VAAVLTGSLRKEVVKCDGYRLVTFGILGQLRGQDVMAMVDKLLSVGLLEAQGRGGLVCSARGRGLLEGGSGVSDGRPRAPIGLLPGVVDSERLDQAIRSGLLDALRRYRAEKARQEDVPEWQVLPEAIVRSVATRLPANDAELTQVPGMGPKRIAAYGASVLGIVAEHVPIIERLRAQSGAALPEAVSVAD
jgi:ATP-dependent DNA helicase RecQ